MLFNSIDFLLFFPVVVILLFALPPKIRNVFLLGASLYFYMCWKAKYIVLIGFSIVVTFLAAHLINYFENKFLRKMTLFFALSANLLILFVFKYYNFFVDNVAAITGVNLPLFAFVLPVGISFYTFQALGYVIDVYRKTISPEKNLFTYALFISFFPQLVAGPIERATNLLPQVQKPAKFTYDNMRSGLLLMGYGFFQKLVIADRLALFVNRVYADYQNVNAAFLLLAAVLFAFQIYCDFASYSNIAIGAARVMGYRLMRNFNAPYLSKSTAEYWTRWHISLSTWFQDYIFEPIVWNSKNRKRASYIALFTVFLISGFWHGASWTFVAWGCIHAFFRAFGLITKKKRKKLYKKLKIDTKSHLFAVGQTITTFFLICLTHIYFRCETIEKANYIIYRIATQTNLSDLFTSGIFEFSLGVQDAVVALVALIVLMIADVITYKEIDVYQIIIKNCRAVRWLIYWCIIFTVVLFGIYGPAYEVTPFIYFQF